MNYPSSILEAHHISKKFKDIYALKNVDLHIYPGDVIALIGHNGAGKSTLFDVLGGLSAPTSGEIVNKISQTNIGWCPQREIIDWSLTVRQNVILGYDIRTKSTIHERREYVHEVAQAVKIDHLLHKTAETLSGGELRRVQIARAMVGNPDLMLLDEPTTGLDPEGIKFVFSYINNLSKEGKTAIISTHETSRFAEYCNRVVALKSGRIVADMNVRDFISYSNSNDLWESYKILAGDEN